jgi:S-DNA-T family DNA segregation ATPase FtsK/SpoIIIE
VNPLWRRLYRGDVAPGWLGRRTGRDQPAPYEDHGTNGSNGDHSEDRVEVHRPGPDLDLDGPVSLIPDRPYKAEDHWSERTPVQMVPDIWQHPGRAARLTFERAKLWAKFHTQRLPIYAGRLILWSPNGLYRMTTGVWRWVTDYESRGVLWDAHQHALNTGEWATYKQLRASMDSRVKSRRATVFLGALGTGGLAFLVLSDPVLMVPTVPALVLVLGYSGRPMDRPWIESVVVSAPEARKLTPDMVLMALHAAKLCKETIGPEAPDFVAPGVYREGAGYGAIVDLPFGYTAEQAIKRKTEIAAGLRVDDFRLFVEQVRGDRGHAGQIKLWIADSDPHTRQAKSSPLVKATKFDLWQVVPFGTDERGQLVSFPLVWTSVLIGSLPRMGKSNSMRVLLSAAALDPYVRLIVFDGKGGKDFAALEQVCHAFGAGEDDDVTGALVAQLTDLEKEMRERYKRLRRLPDDVCPEGKVTPGLTRRRDMDMPLTVVAIDEFHAYMENRRYGKAIEALLTSLIKMGPASGIILVAATQRPSSKIMETDFRDVFGTRFAMRVTTREFSEMILGSGAYKLGLDASRFLPTHKGVGILRGTDNGELADQGGRTVHAYVMDLVEFSAVCKRARALRDGAGTLTGVAAGEEAEVLSDQFLHHVNQAFRGEPKAHSDVLCARLAEDYPGLYADPDTHQPAWDASDLAAALSRYGIKGGNQIWAPRLEDGDGANRKGFTRQPIIDALANRTPPVPDSPDEWPA